MLMVGAGEVSMLFISVKVAVIVTTSFSFTMLSASLCVMATVGCVLSIILVNWVAAVLLFDAISIAFPAPTSTVNVPSVPDIVISAV